MVFCQHLSPIVDTLEDDSLEDDSPIVDTLEDESHEVEAEEDDREDQLVVLQLNNVAVESEAEEHHVLSHDHEVDEELPHLW